MAHSLKVSVVWAGAGRPSLAEADLAKADLDRAVALLTLAGLLPAEVTPAVVTPAAAVSAAFVACSASVPQAAKKAAKAAGKQESADKYKAACAKLTGLPYQAFKAWRAANPVAARAVHEAARRLAGQKAA